MTGLLVTGTGRNVGATVVSAALAALALARGQRATVLKPAETGVPDGADGDLAAVARLAPGVQVVELTRFPNDLSPAAAARASGRAPLDPARCVRAVLDAQAVADLVVVEGTGGLLARYDDDGFTMAELARTLRLPVLVVAEAGRGTLGHAALTLEVMAHRGLELAGLVIGSWPQEPTLAARSDVADLEMLAARPLLGALAEGLGRAEPKALVTAALRGLSPALGGTFDAVAFRRGSS